jgi:cell division septation protein DedD
MTQQMVSRSQRRMEKKQTLFMVSMLLVVGLVCFFLGVMVGRSGEQSMVAEEHLPIQKPLAAAQGEVAEPKTEESPATPVTSDEMQNSPLTFYDTLAEGQQNALGSGINLPPEPEKSEPAPESISKAPVKATESVKVVATPKPIAAPALPVAPKPVVSKPAAVASGSYIVQVAAVKQRDGADGLCDSMKKKGYAAFVQAADLGAKGVWYRIYAGPFSSKADADQAVRSLKADRISSAPLIKRR